VVLKKLPDWLIDLCKDIKSSGGRAFLVGGCVRDGLLGHLVKDYDIEVYRLPSAQVREILERHGKVNTVGEHFAVYKLRPSRKSDTEVDVSLPRRESKHGSGHRGFIVQGDPWLSFQEAASRRDFTINAILYDPIDGIFIDPCNGLRDLNNKELRAVNANTFKDDSLRVLRAAQLSSRYRLRIEESTKLLCQNTNLKDIPKERIWEELKKILLFSPVPSLGFTNLLELGVINQLFPMLWELHSSLVIQNPYSPRDSAWNYVLASLNRGRFFAEELSEPEKISVFLSIIGTRLTHSSLISFLDCLGLHTYRGFHVREQVITLRNVHLLPYKAFYQAQQGKPVAFILRRIARLTDPKLVDCLVKALFLEASEQIVVWFEENLQALGAEKPFLRGRHILELGIPPGPTVRKILLQVYEYQIDGQVNSFENAKLLASDLLSKMNLRTFQESGLRNSLT